jgi:RNA polymerase sigma-70 factor (ECF subfamily)
MERRGHRIRRRNHGDAGIKGAYGLRSVATVVGDREVNYDEDDAMSSMAGAPTLSELASAIGFRTEEASIVAELQAGSEEAFAWLIAQYSQPVYGLVYRVLDDPSDAADTTQEVFIKVFRGIRRFHADSSLKTWIYRIALHEASNQRRWWYRHKMRETSIEPGSDGHDERDSLALRDILVDDAISPLDSACNEELRARVELELKSVAEPYRTAVILRDIEELSYEQIAEVMEVSLGTVKSRLVRGRDALRKRLERHLPSLGVNAAGPHVKKHRTEGSLSGQEVEVMP